MQRARTTPSILWVDGVFDGVAAAHVEEVLRAARAGERLLLDLTQVREFHDFGIAVLARALARCAAEVRVRGLRPAQLRVLLLFGVDAGPIERAVLPEGI